MAGLDSADQHQVAAGPAGRPILVCLGIVLGVVAVGCSASKPAATEAKPVTLSIAVPIAKNLGADRPPGIVLNGLDFERVTTYDAHGRPAPKVAERWLQSPDGLQWRLTIRQGVRFQDGTPLTPNHVREAILAGAADSQVSHQTTCLPDIVGVTTEPPQDIVIRLRRPCSFLLDDLEVDVSVAGPDGARIGTGPYRPVASTADEATFEANPSYYGGRPSIDRIVVRTYDTLRAPWAEMMRGQVDMLHEVGPEGLEFLKDQSAVNIWSYPSFKPVAVVLNSGRTFLAPSEVRHALSLAVNRTELVSVGLRGQGVPGDTPIWPGFWALEAGAPSTPFDPTRAKAILARKAPLAFTCLLPAGHSGFERMALMVQRQWQAVGVEMKLEVVPIPVLYQRVGGGDFDAAMIDPLGGPYASLQYRFWHSPDPHPRWNLFNYRSAAVDAALDAMRGAIDDHRFKEAVKQYLDAIRVDPPAIILAWPVWTQAISRRFEVPAEAAGSTAVRSIPNWRLRNDHP